MGTTEETPNPTRKNPTVAGNKYGNITAVNNPVAIMMPLICNILFTPNFTTKTSGTGLGLAMCKRMAEQAGGVIRFETNENGTSFFVTLPLHNNHIEA